MIKINVCQIVIISLLILFCPSGKQMPTAEGGERKANVSVQHGSRRLVTIEGWIMFIDLNQLYIVLNEKHVILKSYIKNRNTLSVIMKNASGDDVGLDSFEVGQWVAITGYEISKDKLQAISCQAVNGCLRRNRQRIDKLRLSR